MSEAASIRLDAGAMKSPLRGLFVAWLLVFYVTWIAIVAFGGLGPVVCSHWPISVAMAGGSFVAGSSPVAGGTVGFPVLVYVFDHPGKLGTSFSLMIQSIGMVSASVYILTRRRQVEWRILNRALLGALIGMPVGMFWIAPNIADIWVKLLFSVVYASFGLLHLIRLREIVAIHGPSRNRFAADPIIGIAVGVLGGLLASVIGVGADILLYGILVLLYNTDVKVAIPTAVILMAFTSLVGTGCSLLASIWSPSSQETLAEVFPYWLAAAPVVVIGGPLGSFVSRFVPRWMILGGVAVLCLSQYGWTCYHEHIVGWSLVLAAFGVLALNFALHLLFEFGRRSLPANS